MTTPYNFPFNPDLDLKLERVVDVTPEQVWAAWTQPQHLVKWFTPAPWSTASAEVDLRPGGSFLAVMRSPEGQEFSNVGCYLEVVENRRLVWTTALAPGYRPLAPHAPKPDSEVGKPLLITAAILIEPAGKGTRYTAIVLHGNREDVQRHEAMGFHQGWSKALDQLVAIFQEK